MGHEVTPGDDIDTLETDFHGDVIRPGDHDYDAARTVWNGMIDKRPAVIARCRDVADVITAVEFARENGLLVAVRGGGHNAAGLGTCEDGIVIDLSPMDWVDVDPDAQRVRVGGGALWQDVDHAAQAFGLAVPGGVVSTTGVAGLTLGGGYGHLRRKYGLTCDNLVSADVVTADGRYLTASEDQHQDLFWGLRGGGGNFGIVTAFEFTAHPIGREVATVETWHRFEDAPAVMTAWRDFVEGAQRDVTGEIIVWSVPADPHFPEDLHEEPVVIASAVHCGDPADGERILQPLRDVGDPAFDFSGRTPYLDLQRGFDPFFPAGEHRYYQGSVYLEGMTDEIMSEFLDRAQSRPDPRILYYIWQLGGAIDDVPDDATAFSDRGHPYLLAIDCTWDRPEDDDAVLEWARTFRREMRTHSSGADYRNFPGIGEEADKPPKRGNDHDQTHERLVEVKTRYDPDNLFSLNQNITPRA